jgi:hypothetical protein
MRCAADRFYLEWQIDDVIASREKVDMQLRSERHHKGSGELAAEMRLLRRLLQLMVARAMGSAIVELRAVRSCL